jgi:hypothetical protein
MPGHAPRRVRTPKGARPRVSEAPTAVPATGLPPIGRVRGGLSFHRKKGSRLGTAPHIVGGSGALKRSHVVNGGAGARGRFSVSALRITGCGSLLEPALVPVRGRDRARRRTGVGARRMVGALLASAAVICTPAATAQEFEPGDLRVCNARRCVPITNRVVPRAFSSFYYGGPQLAIVTRL